MKITKARLKQIIREEMELLALKEFNGAEEEGAETEDEPGVGAEEEETTEPEEEAGYEATGREKKSAAATSAGGKIGEDEYEAMLVNLLQTSKVMPADRKKALEDLFGAVGLKIHTALLRQSAEQK